METRSNQHQPPQASKSKLRPLVITMGSERQAHIEKLFAHPSMAAHFDKPVFSPGIPSRSIRNQMTLLTAAGKAGILPPHEWDAISSPRSQKLFEEDAVTFLEECLKDVPVVEGRKGAKYDVERHYAKELWQKGKALNKGRAVMACSLAHLMAMKTLVEEGFDFILEDNVRAPLTAHDVHANGAATDDDHDSCNGTDDKCDRDGENSTNQGDETERKHDSRHRPNVDTAQVCECARRIRNTIQASEEMEQTTGTSCHLRFYGWLGSRPNLEFVMDKFIPERHFKRKYQDKGTCNENDDSNNQHSGSDPYCNQHQTVFPYVQKADIEEMLGDDYDEKDSTKAGGSPLWGAFAYWISKEGYESLIQSLQNDVGAMLWKGKRMRCYQVKPIDKIIPRRIANAFTVYEEDKSEGNIENGGGQMVRNGREHIHVATHPAFFRAPMLTSQIHTKWDAEFCRSTEYQMWRCNQRDSIRNSLGTKTSLSAHEKKEVENEKGKDRKMGQEWRHLWLTEKERRIVNYRMKNDGWLTMNELEEVP